LSKYQTKRNQNTSF